MKKEFIYKGIYFNEGTPLALCDTLINLYQTKQRIVLDYGDIQTGESWGDFLIDIAGSIGKSTGTTPALLLIHNSKSIGGAPILTNCVLSIKTSKGKHLIYKHSNI